MELADFDFVMPEDRIALRPVSPRDSARMLVVEAGGGLEDRLVRDLPEQLRAGDVLVFNDTRVIPARLAGVRRRGDSVVVVEATLLKRLGPSRWSALMRPGKRLRVSDSIVFGEAFEASIAAKAEDGEIILEFAVSGPDLDRAIAISGVMPLPPYIAARRPEDERDRTDYQTIYARENGSVAAPTAGLHFTNELLGALKRRGVDWTFVTLHVGAGTFLPVKTDVLSRHRMHSEHGEVSAETAAKLNSARAAGGRIISVGTTSLRLLESAVGRDEKIIPFTGETAIFITPGHRFRTADALITNFHLPKSTLFMLVAAFSGLEVMRETYRHAIDTGYRFYSYGDASLLWRAR